MALVGGAPQNDGQWATRDEEDAGPVTSRSPAFVPSTPSVARHAPLESLVVIAEPARRHESGVQAVARVAGDAPWGARQVALRVSALKLEESARATRYQDIAMALINDINAVGEALESLVSSAADEVGGLMSHAYEWATNVLVRADDMVSAGQSRDELAVDEYSSLFLRAILDPMLGAAVAARTREGDARAVRDLGALGEAAFHANWTARRLWLARQTDT